jgi:hypothetical protein
MKVGEQILYDNAEDKIVIQKTHDVNPELHRAEMLREAGVGQTGEKRLVGTIPLNLIAEWCKEAGVKWDDTLARQEVVKRKILSGDFDKFRVWKGTY